MKLVRKQLYLNHVLTVNEIKYLTIMIVLHIVSTMSYNLPVKICIKKMY